MQFGHRWGRASGAIVLLNFSIKGISSFCLRRVVESAAWVAQFTSLRAESRHGPELFLRYLDAAWADCVVSVYPELRFFYGELPTRSFHEE